MIRIHVAPGVDEVGRLAAAEILDAVGGRAEGVLGLATGGSVEPVYAALHESRQDFGRVSAVALDEYVGLAPDDPRSYAATILRSVIEPLGLDPARVHVPPGTDALADPGASDRFEQTISDLGGVDLQLLGIGRNGHLGFNEPGSASDSRTRVVDLAETTRRDNARFFGHLNDVPSQALTQGLGTILDARRLLLVAIGEAKAEAVAAALDGPVTEDIPASLLRRHPRVTVVLDEAAASRLAPRTAAARTLLLVGR